MQQQEEIWKDIPGYEGMYQVSDLGNVKSLPRQIKRKDGRICFFKGTFLKKVDNGDGYLVVNLKSKTYFVSVLVAMAFLNHTPSKYKIIVDHINNIRNDNRLNNLQLITTRKNTSKDKIGKGSSKYTGVYWGKRAKKWCSTIVFNSKKIYLGSFETEEQASDFYKKAVLCIEKGEEIPLKRREYTSKHTGVNYNKKIKKWHSRFNNGKERIHLGFFKTEEEAYNVILNYKNINNGK
jgi:hypothetical protein